MQGTVKHERQQDSVATVSLSFTSFTTTSHGGHGGECLEWGAKAVPYPQAQHSPWISFP